MTSLIAAIPAIALLALTLWGISGGGDGDGWGFVFLMLLPLVTISCVIGLVSGIARVKQRKVVNWVGIILNGGFLLIPLGIGLSCVSFRQSRPMPKNVPVYPASIVDNYSSERGPNGKVRKEMWQILSDSKPKVVAFYDSSLPLAKKTTGAEGVINYSYVNKVGHEVQISVTDSDLVIIVELHE